MRKIILSMLIAGAAVSPAIAQDQGRWRQEDAQADRQQARDVRHQARDERQQARAEARGQRSGGDGDNARVEQQPRFVSAPRVDVRQDAQAGFDSRRFERRNAVQAEIQAPQPPQLPPQFGGRRARGDFSGARRDDSSQAGATGWNGEDRWARRGGDLRQSDRPLPTVMRDPNPLIVRQTPHEGTQPPLRAETRRYSGSNWSTSWRNNSRYDWRRWRDGHHSTFRVGIYYDPFGWNYHPYRIGWRLWPSYYNRNYWINDPWQYRLPYAPPGTAWVRYWDDALLVDIYSGEVIDVIRDFFW